MPAPSFIVRLPLVAALVLAGLSAHVTASDHSAPTAAKAADKAEPKADGKVEPRAEPKVEARAEGRPEAKSEPKSAAKGNAKAEPADAHDPAPSNESRRPKLPESRDPLDVVRERLAAKLGATRPPDTANPNVVRVTTKATSASGNAHETIAALAPASTGSHYKATGGDIVIRPRAAAARAAAGTVAGAGEPVAAMSGVEPGHAHWEYGGAGGPESWGQLKPEFAKCSNGARQSPIDIRDGIKVNLDPVQFDYKPSGFRVIDNGHTVQVNVGTGNSIEVMGRRYDLVQFHFHRPSEERIDGKQFDMVVHLVHKDLDGRLAVVAVLLDRGAAQPLIQSVWNNLPLEKGEEVAARVSIDLNALLPAERSYFTYMGSLTTPPCSEGVLWMVMKSPVHISAEQIGIFARLYPMNARPIQQASGRLIKESN
ncbi:hypothetical protein BH11PSE8_BH11PSE8_42540 [soil metagenome]